jgi:hypothetical protein
MASRMQDPGPGARNGMQFPARLDTAVAILDELSAKLWTSQVREGVMRD